MPKNTKIRRNPDLVTVYHRSYDPIPPHIGALGGRSPKVDLSTYLDLESDDEEYGPVGSADMEKLARKELSKGFYSGLNSDTWKSAVGNPRRDQEGVLLGATDDKRVHGPKTVFTGPLQTVKSPRFSERVFSHRYKVPKSAIAETVYADDDIGISPHSEVLGSVSPVPLRRDRVIKSGQVHQMANSMEGPRDQSNLVFAKKDMDKLGIQFAGTLVHINSLEDEDDFEKVAELRKGRRFAYFDPYNSSAHRTTTVRRVR